MKCPVILSLQGYDELHAESAQPYPFRLEYSGYYLSSMPVVNVVTSTSAYPFQSTMTRASIVTTTLSLFSVVATLMTFSTETRNYSATITQTQELFEARVFGLGDIFYSGIVLVCVAIAIALSLYMRRKRGTRRRSSSSNIHNMTREFK